MKTTYRHWLIAALLVAGGCGGKDTTPPEKTPESGKPVTRQFAEEVTGYRAVQQGRQVQETLRRIGDERERDMQGVMNEEGPR